MSINERELLKKFKTSAAILNFKSEIEGENLKIKERRYINFKKKAIVTLCTSSILASGIVFAVNNEKIKEHFRGLGNGIDSAIKQCYIYEPKENYNKSDANLDINEIENIDNIIVDSKIDTFLMDDYNISTEFNLKIDEKINKYVNLENIDSIILKDLIIRDEENRILFVGNDKESFENYCKENNLNYIFGETNENYYNSGLNCFPYYNKEGKILKLMYNIYSDNYPKSKKLYYSFGKILIKENKCEKTFMLNGNWKLEIDVPEKMYNRTKESYKILSCDNEDINVYSATVSDTGFEIGMIIENLESPEFPNEIKEVEKEIKAQYDNYKDFNKALNEKLCQPYYAEILVEYSKKLQSPIKIGDNEDDSRVSYVENANGRRFKSTESPSRNYKGEWLNDKYNFYETFGMTKNDATDKIKVVLYYYGEPVTIELEKNK